MSKFCATLVILALSLSVSYSQPVYSNQWGSIPEYYLDQSVQYATIVYNGQKNSTGSGNTDADWITLQGNSVAFGAGSTNTTSYVYGLVISKNKINTIFRREINAAIAFSGNDTLEACIQELDTSIGSLTIPAMSYTSATASGYYFLVSTGIDQVSHINQVYINLLATSGSSTQQTIITSNTYYTNSTITLGTAWYDNGSGAFFFTWTHPVSNVFTIYLQGWFVANNSSYFTSTLSIVAASGAGTAVTNLIGGGDNYNNASNIYLV